MRTRDVIRKALLLALILAAGLEAIAWTRAGFVELLQKAYPAVGVGTNGDPIYWHVVIRTEGRELRQYAEILDDGRQKLAEVPAWEKATEWGYPPLIRGWSALVGRDAPWERFEDPPLVAASREPGPWPFDPRVRLDPLFSLAFFQNGNTRHRMREGHWAPPRGLLWRLEEGRFVCRAAATNEVVAGFGPEGYVDGPDAAKGERFGDLAVVWVDGSRGSPDRLLLFDRGRLALVHVKIRPSPGDERQVYRQDEPVFVEVRVDPLRAAEGSAADAKRQTFLIETDTERLLVGDDGVIVARAPRPLDEAPMPMQVSNLHAVFHGDSKVTTATGPMNLVAGGPPWACVDAIPVPVDPIRERHRFHLLRINEAPRTVEVELAPVTALEHFLAGLVLLPDLVLPLPLAAASAGSEAPPTWKELNRWWWRSPALADGRRPLLLALVVLVALACAVLTRRSARLRCTTLAAVHAWTAVGAVLGPLGLLWVRLCLGRARIEEVADGRRAANLDTAPAGHAPWPAPARLGIEVTD